MLNITTENNDNLFIRNFSFGATVNKEGYTNVNSNVLFSDDLGYGFITESVKEKDELLQLAELGSAFEIQQGFSDEAATTIHISEGATIGSTYVPLCFRVKVPESGNYNVTLKLGNTKTDSIVTVFSERRRCVLRNRHIKAGEVLEYSFTSNVCDIIPRGKTEAYIDDGLDIAIIGENATLLELSIDEAFNTPTIYIAGDSTVTDQSAQYPYNPATSYCGWAQMFPMFLQKGISISNHAHSGLTTSSFKREGHWSIVEKNIKKNDIFFIQFGHNDQKDKTLDPFGGYAENLRIYIDEVRNFGAYPIIVTPVSRTIWNGPNDSFNDMLKEYAMACKKVAEEKDVPVLDLHGKSVEFILSHGPKDSVKYFYPKDWTHHNDFGGVEMAKFVVEAIKESSVQGITKFLQEIPEDPIHEEHLSNWKETSSENQQEEYKKWVQANQWAQEFTLPEYKDIENHWAKSAIETVVRLGIIKGSEDKFLPEKELNRVEFFDVLLKSLRLTPTNVYNDMFEDVFGDEWYAGIVQASYDKELIPDGLVQYNKFKPEALLSLKEAINIMIHVYKTKLNKEFSSSTELLSLEESSIVTQAVVAVLITALLDKFKEI
jgi:lysophospholipase L1-like esterase